MLTEDDKAKLQQLSESRRSLVRDMRGVINLAPFSVMSAIPERFIYEFLQNAEDVKAMSISFHLHSDKMLVEHDGEPFSYEDIDEITKCANSSKGDRRTLIGEHGIGFKSVFCITDRPRICSGDYHIDLEDMIVPVPVSGKNGSSYSEKTIFTLPFKENICKDDVEKYIDHFKEACLLFLTRLQKVCFHFHEDNEKLFYERLLKEKSGNRRVSLLKNEEQAGTYLLFEKPSVSSAKVQIAYKLDGKDQIKEPDLKNIFVFFPTTVPSHLNFLIQAPYETTPSRDSIRESEKNDRITEDLATLVAESLYSLKQENQLTWDFLKLLPLQKGWQTLYCKVHEAISEELRKEPLLPTSEGQYAKAEECIIATEAVRSLFRPEQLMEGKEKWLSDQELGSLQGFFKGELQIESLTLRQVAKKIDNWEVFLKEKDDKWFLKLYERLSEDGEEARKDREAFKSLPIIPLESGGFGKPEATYLPLKKRKSGYQTVKHTLAEKEIAKKLFELYHMEKPNGITEIEKKIAPKYKEGEVKFSDDDEYANDLRKIEQIWKEANTDQQESIKKILRPAKIVRTEEGDYRKAEEVYLPLEDLKTWYKGLGKSFVDKDTYDDFGNILEKLGCRKEIESHASSSSTRYERERDGFKRKFEITDLKEVLDQINLERSIILWKTLMKHRCPIKGEVESRRTLSDWADTEVKEEFSVVGQLLNKCENGWLYDKEEKLIPKDRLGEVSPPQLHDNYQEYVNNNPADADKLAKQLGMKPDMMSKVEYEAELEAERCKTRKAEAKNTKAEAEITKLKAEIRELKRQREEKNSTENTNPQDGQEEQNDQPAELINITAVPRNSTRRRSDTSQPASYGDGVSGRSRGSQEDGSQGEKVAYDHLCKEHGKNKVTWCNKNGESSKPYDITIQNGDDKIYVEVKSIKRRSPPAQFEFSSRQKEFALSHQQNYRIVCVFLDPDGQQPPKLGEINDVKERHFERHKFLYYVEHEQIELHVPDAGEDD